MTRPRGTAVLIAYYAPPALGIAAQRIRGFVRHLPSMGWDPVVIVPTSVHYHRNPEEVWTPEGAAVVRVSNPEPSRWLRSIFRRTGAATHTDGSAVDEMAPVKLGTAGDRIRRWIREFVFVPDAQALWIPGASRAAREAVAEARGRPTVLFSTSVPFSAHFAALRAASGTGVPWVAEYRDPWSVSPPQSGSRSALRRLVDRRLDGILVQGANALVTTSDATAARYRTAFPELARRRVVVVRNGFEPGGTASPPPPAEPLALVYSGTLLRTDYAKTLLAALDRVGEPGAVAVHVYGPAEMWRKAAGGRPRSDLHLHGMVPSGDMPAHLAGASANVLLQPDPAHSEYVAGKLYEYLGSGRPILAALPPGSEARRLGRDHGDLRIVHPLAPDGLADAIRTLLAEHREGRLQTSATPAERVAPLTRRAQTANLAALFDALAGR